MGELDPYDENAARLGAVASREAYYPTWRTWLGETAGGHLFAIHYFDASGGEVGYYLPDFCRFHPMGTLHTFDPPRQWHTPLLATLGPARPLT